MKRPLLLAAFALAVALAGGSTAAAGSRSASLLIRHQVQGCHAWSLDGKTYRAAQVVHLAVGGTLSVVDNDVMPQQLVQTSGPRVRFVGSPTMNHMAASVKTTFRKAGVYTFVSKGGEDYKGINAKTTGEDFNLTLKVVVR